MCIYILLYARCSVWRSLLTFHEYVHISGADTGAWICIRAQFYAPTHVLDSARWSIVRQCIRSVHCRVADCCDDSANRPHHALLPVTPERAASAWNIILYLCCVYMHYSGECSHESHTSHAQKPIVDTTMWVNAGTRRTPAGARPCSGGTRGAVWRGLRAHRAGICMRQTGELEPARIMQPAECSANEAGWATSPMHIYKNCQQFRFYVSHIRKVDFYLCIHANF